MAVQLTEAAARHVQPVEIIEDEIPLYDVRCEVEVGEKEVKSVALAPQGDALEFTQEGESVTFTVPQLRSHQMVEICY